MKCKKCKHWKSQQAELGYATCKGICTCYMWEYKMNNYSDITILDRENIHNTHHDGTQRIENQNKEVPCGRKNKSQYCLVTSESFGCIHFDK